jgi:hypothetical protein
MQITIQGKQFEVSSPYQAGPIELSEGEAHTLNQTRHENIRNNFAKKVKDWNGQDDLQSAITAYDNEYQFGLRGEGGGASRDPVEVEARGLVRAAIKTKLKEINQTADAKAINAAVDALLASEKGEKFREAARTRVTEKQEIAQRESAAMNDILSSIGGTEPAYAGVQD